MAWNSIYALLKDVGAFAGLGLLLKTGITAYRNRLRTCDKQLLVAGTTGDGFIHYRNYPNLHKPWVKAGLFDLGDSPMSEAEFVDSLNRLVQRGYVYEVKPSLYTLSSKGIRAAQSFARRIKLDKIPSAQNSGEPRGNRISLSTMGASVG